MSTGMAFLMGAAFGAFFAAVIMVYAIGVLGEAGRVRG